MASLSGDGKLSEHYGKRSVIRSSGSEAWKREDVENFLMGGLSLVMEEPDTVVWFGIRIGPSTFGIFDAFPNEAGRQAHLTGKVAAALMARAGELFSKPPSIEKVDVLAAKLPAEQMA